MFKLQTLPMTSNMSGKTIELNGRVSSKPDLITQRYSVSIFPKISSGTDLGIRYPQQLLIHTSMMDIHVSDIPNMDPVKKFIPQPVSKACKAHSVGRSPRPPVSMKLGTINSRGCNIYVNYL
jgi:hypothetical protein